MERAQYAQGVRKKLENGKKRHEFQLDHGFRKWFKTQCEIAGMKSINIEILMGHSIGISDSYYRATDHDLLKNYRKASDFLTIQVEHRLHREVSELTDKSLGQEYMIKSRLEEKDLAIDAPEEPDKSNLRSNIDNVSGSQTGSCKVEAPDKASAHSPKTEHNLGSSGASGASGAPFLKERGNHIDISDPKSNLIYELDELEERTPIWGKENRRSSHIFDSNDCKLGGETWYK